MNYETLARKAEEQATRARESAVKHRWAGDPAGEREWKEMAEESEARARELRAGEEALRCI